MNARLIINAPFGNYFAPQGTLPVYGTFTSERRPGRFRQVLKTVRRVNGGWINQIGLRNPGIRSYVQDCRYQRASIFRALPRHIVSIHGSSTDDWRALLDELTDCYYGGHRIECTVELNASCPNVVDDETNYTTVFRAAHSAFPKVIVKIGPTQADFRRAAEALAEGISAFNAGNSWPTPVGGVSGPPLKPHSLEMVRQLRMSAPPSTVIIGTGGIVHPNNVYDYAVAGADYVGVASLLLLPWRSFTVLPRIARRAAQLLEGRNSL